MSFVKEGNFWSLPKFRTPLEPESPQAEVSKAVGWQGRNDREPPAGLYGFDHFGRGLAGEDG